MTTSATSRQGTRSSFVPVKCMRSAALLTSARVHIGDGSTVRGRHHRRSVGSRLKHDSCGSGGAPAHDAVGLTAVSAAPEKRSKLSNTPWPGRYSSGVTDEV